MAFFLGSAIAVAMGISMALENARTRIPPPNLGLSTQSERMAFSRRHAPAPEYMSYRAYGR